MIHEIIFDLAFFVLKFGKCQHEMSPFNAIPMSVRIFLPFWAKSQALGPVRRQWRSLCNQSVSDLDLNTAVHRTQLLSRFSMNVSDDVYWSIEKLIYQLGRDHCAGKKYASGNHASAIAGIVGV